MGPYGPINHSSRLVVKGLTSHRTFVSRQTSSPSPKPGRCIASPCLGGDTWLQALEVPVSLRDIGCSGCGVRGTTIELSEPMATQGAPFQALQLTPDEQQTCRDQSFLLLDRTLRSYDERDGQEDNGRPTTPLHHSNLDSTRWKQLKTQANASLYLERSSSVHRDDNLLGSNWKNPMVFLMRPQRDAGHEARGLRRPERAGGPHGGGSVPVYGHPVDGLQARLAAQNGVVPARLRDARVERHHDARQQRPHRLPGRAAGEPPAMPATARVDAHPAHVRRHLQTAGTWRRGRVRANVHRDPEHAAEQSRGVGDVEVHAGPVGRAAARRDEEAAVVHRQLQGAASTTPAAGVSVGERQLQTVSREAQDAGQ
ncbi:hypothetical protein ON010_g18840 [Phytophthora cinnamomi]|nr:hypothetical protein ON010_g18840 [Phytophthora cinnamomi]